MEAKELNPLVTAERAKAIKSLSVKQLIKKISRVDDVPMNRVFYNLVMAKSEQCYYKRGKST